MDEEKKEVIIIRRFPAGIERLWQAFTEKEEMLKWWSPVGMTTPHVESDLREGGAWSVTMEYDETGEQVTVRGVYKEIKNPSTGSGQAKLSFTWKWDGSEEETDVHFFFKEINDDETELTLIHRGFSPTPAKVDVDNNWTHESHKQGWTTAFTKLERLIH